MPSLLVTIRGPVEAIEAAAAGAELVDIESPAAATGTPYPLNILAVRERLDREGYSHVKIVTGIGDRQNVRAAACQAAVGVAVAGADIIKFGLAEESLEAAVYLGATLVRTVRHFGGRHKRIYPVLFVDEDMRRWLNPFESIPDLVARTGADGALLDVHNKLLGRGLLDICKLDHIARLADSMHEFGKELWLAGALDTDELRRLAETGADVISIHAAPAGARGRPAPVESVSVRDLMSSLAPAQSPPRQRAVQFTSGDPPPTADADEAQERPRRRRVSPQRPGPE